MRGAGWSSRWEQVKSPLRFLTRRAAHRGCRLNAGRSLFDPAQDRLGTAHVITPGRPLIPPRDPEVGQRTDMVTASSLASRARAADDDVERPAREPVLRPAAAHQPHESLDFAEVRRASPLPPCHDTDGPAP